MTKSQRLVKLQGLDRAGRRELSEKESCKAKELETPHERLMFAAGFRKGLAQALRGDRSFRRAEVRGARGRPVDKLWARGFNRGVNYVPVDTPKRTKARPLGAKLTKADLRRIKRTGTL